MQQKNRTNQNVSDRLAPRLYSIPSMDYSFYEVLELMKQQLGEYPGTLLQKPVAVDYLSLKENILLAYSIVYPTHTHIEQTLEDAFEEEGIDLNDLSSIPLADLSLQAILKIQLITLFLCQIKVILLDDWVSDLPEEDARQIMLYLKRVCQERGCSILIYTSNPTIVKQCDETICLDNFPLNIQKN